MEMRSILNILEQKEYLPVVIRKALKIFFANIDWGSDAETVVYALGYDSEEINHKFLRTRKFKSELRQWAIKRIYKAKNIVEQKLRETKYTVWREITAPEDWKPDPNRHPGIYWSWNKSAAEAHWGEHPNAHYLLTAKIKNSDINWAATIAANADLNTEDECEVCLYPESKISFTYERVK